MAGNQTHTRSCYPMHLPTNKAARCPLKFNVITPKGVWPIVEDKLLEGTNETRMPSMVKLSMPLDSGKRKPEMPLDGQRCKKQKMSIDDQWQRKRVSVVVTKKLEANVPEMSIDDQRWKKQNMDCNVKAECSKLLKELVDRRLAQAFTKPVDLIKTPDYFKKIKNPMDLGTIKRNLERNMYSDAKEFADDMVLTFRNAMLYHSPTNEVYRNARLLNCNFKRRWEILAKKMKLVVEKSHQVMKPAAAAGLMKAPKAEQRGYSRREKTALNGCTSLRKTSDKGVNRCQEAAIDAYTRGAVPIEAKSPCSTSATTPTSAAEGVQMSPKKASRVAMLKGRFAEMAARERERKAARMALEKIKKTVEIDTSPILLKEMSILFGCYSNPKALEKVGFYLKQNYVEEYEV
ncbi:hypothetical protein SASPL_132654 [Salvia splendens]|uniref:Bromo domain-containing protein n=1 Tax=Salvia splendens TaxID=180675 RepID=A0A8X8ZHB9_SALSN|nr:hypothetical protein SASPL_132654 [Salvia splendens]